MICPFDRREKPLITQGIYYSSVVASVSTRHGSRFLIPDIIAEQNPALVR